LSKKRGKIREIPSSSFSESRIYEMTQIARKKIRESLHPPFSESRICRITPTTQKKIREIPLSPQIRDSNNFHFPAGAIAVKF
jgi:hypothetical protein